MSRNKSYLPVFKFHTLFIFSSDTCFISRSNQFQLQSKDSKIKKLEFILHSIQTCIVHLNPPYLELFLGKPGNNTPESMW